MECIKVCPPASELSVIKNHIVCTEEGCGKVFHASSALDMHITKHHQHSSLTRRSTAVPTYYYCPEVTCMYHVNGTRFFTRMKYLKQHYLKVHGERKFACVDCTKAFPTQEALHHHKQICGITFRCSCGSSYASYEALLTHSKRKQHSFDEKFKQLGKRVKSSAPTALIRNDMKRLCSKQPPPIYILPKLSSDTVGVPVNILAAVALTELSGSCSKTGVDKDVQTDHIETRRKKASSPARASERGTKRRASAQTQTGIISKTRRPRRSAKTQTVADGNLEYHCHFSMFEENDHEMSKDVVGTFKRKKSMETQTSLCNFGSTDLSMNRSFQMQCGDITGSPKLHTNSSSLSSSPLYPLAKDVGLPDLWFAHKNTSSTQTSPISANQTSIPSDLNYTFFECDSNVPSSNLRNLNYFEENSDSLDNVVNSTVSHFERTSSNSAENLDPLESLSSESSYRTPMYPLLSQRESRSCNIETQTELDPSTAFLSQCSDNSADGQFIPCSNIETQTTEDIFDELLYSNMCTQTCDENLFSDLDFADIETQTAWPNYNESNETKLISDENQSTGSSTSLPPNTTPSAIIANTKHTQANSKQWPAVVKLVMKKSQAQDSDHKS